MNESQLIDDLRVALDDATAHLGAQPGATQRARATGRRRRATRGLLAAVPAVALAAGLVVLTQSGAAGPAAGPGASARPGAGATASAPPVQTAAYVAKQVASALANASRYIVRTAQQNSPGTADTQWSDPRTGSSYLVQGTGSRKQASWQSTYYAANVLHWRETDVDYASRTWSALTQHAAGTSSPPTGPQVPGGSPAQVRQWLKSGTFRIVGHGDVNGHHTTELRAALGPVNLFIWADSQTFQVVRTIKSFTGGGLKGDSVIENDSWLPRSAALVKLISHPQIPAGFTRVPAPS